MSDDKPFKQESIRTKIFIITVVAVMLIAAIGVITAAYFFGIIGLFRLLGVHYDSFGALFWFITGYLLFGTVGELTTNVMRIFMRKAKKWTDMQIDAGFLLLSFLVNLIIISFLDNIMHSIEIEAVTRVVVSIIFALIDYAMDAKLGSNQESRKI